MIVKGRMLNKLYTELIFAYNRVVYSDWERKDDCFLLNNIIYLYEGEGRFGRDGVYQTVKAPCLIYFPPGCSQYISAVKNKHLKYYTLNFLAAVPAFKPNTAAGIADWEIENAEFDFPFVKPFDNAAIQSQITVIFERLCRMYLTGGAPFANERQQQAILDLLFLSRSIFGGGISQSAIKRVSCVVRFISEHYSEDITLKQLADVAGVSRVYLVKLFNRTIRKSPISYLISIRIAKARQLLSEGCTVADVAERVGFSDIFYFSNTFKKHEGISPSEYRKSAESDDRK